MCAGINPEEGGIHNFMLSLTEWCSFLSSLAGQTGVAVGSTIGENGITEDLADLMETVAVDVLEASEHQEAYIFAERIINSAD